MIQRKEVVLSVLGELQEATESSGLDALTRAALEVEQVLAPFQLPGTPCQEFPEWAGVDDEARGLYPADAPMGLLPLNCKGEGNLLFDAVSMLLVGNTDLSLELQVSGHCLYLAFYYLNVYCCTTLPTMKFSHWRHNIRLCAASSGTTKGSVLLSLHRCLNVLKLMELPFKTVLYDGNINCIVWSPAGTDSGGNGAVEEILPVWDD